LIFKKILVPYDGSKFADKALEHAIAIAELSRGVNSNNTQIILLHVVTEIPIPLTFERPIQSPKTGRRVALSEYITELYEEMKTNALKMLEERKHRYALHEVIIEIKLLVGNPAEKIIDFANQEKVDLIVIGNVGLSGISKVRALGSVSRSVSERASCPVFNSSLTTITTIAI
jgi:nucleotide-binding universal stress UspA family protein